MKRIFFTLAIAVLNCSLFAQSVQRVVLNEQDQTSGYYLVMEPAGYHPGDSIIGVLVLVAGFSQRAENTFPETKLPNVAYANNMLTVCFAGGYKAYMDEDMRVAMNAMFRDVLSRYRVNPEKFVLGGFSAGGTIVLRYTELCHQFPDKYPIKPRGVFMVDSPIDVFTLWDMLNETAKENFSRPAVQEANEAMTRMRNQFGVPKDNVAKYNAVNPFSMNKAYGDNEKWLKRVAVRAYHEVDIAWRLQNRRQTVRMGNYYVTSELIYRLLLMGNERAEFMQSDRIGYRANGMRHPHSWSIVEEAGCVQWALGLFR